MTLSDMAREIERRRPGKLPKSLYFTCVGDLAHKDYRGIAAGLPDDLAHAILRDAMVMALRDSGHCPRIGCTRVSIDIACEEYYFSSQDNCQTRSLFAAFCAALPENDDA